MFNFSRWLIMNLLVPLVPLLLRIFITIFGKEGATPIEIIQMPELLFYSIFTCIVALNINLDGPKKYFEWIVRLLLIVITILDFIVLAMVYSANVGSRSMTFSIVTAIVPALIAPLYKYNILMNEEMEQL